MNDWRGGCVQEALGDRCRADCGRLVGDLARIVVAGQTEIVQFNRVLAAVLDLDLEGARRPRPVDRRKPVSFRVVVPIFTVGLSLGRRRRGVVRLIGV